MSNIERDAFVLIENMKRVIDELENIKMNLTPPDSSITIIVKEKDGVAHQMTFEDQFKMAEYIVGRYYDRT
jgi:hypothetical protein